MTRRGLFGLVVGAAVRPTVTLDPTRELAHVRAYGLGFSVTKQAGADNPLLGKFVAELAREAHQTVEATALGLFRAPFAARRPRA